MNILKDPSVEDNIYTMNISVEMGDLTRTAEEEKDLFNKYPQVLRYKDINFTGKFSVNGAGDVVLKKDGDEGYDEAELVTLQLRNREFIIDENTENNLKISLSINPAKEITDKELGTVLKTKELVAKAKLVLFYQKIKEQIEVLKADSEDKANNTFEDDTEEII